MKKNSPFVATHVTRRNAPAVTDSMINQPKFVIVRLAA